MTVIRVDVSSSSVPHLYRLILAARGHTLPVRRPRYRSYNALMASIDDEDTAGGSTPYLYQLIILPVPIIASRSNKLPIGRPCHSIYTKCMTLIGENITPGSIVPNLHCVILTA